MTDVAPQIPALAGSSSAIRQTRQIINQVAPVNSTVLLLGETGTEKESIAKEIHRLSPRGCGAFVHVNCGALHEGQVATELLATVCDAFKTIKQTCGTVFLGDLDLATPKIQIGLLQVFQEQQFQGLMSAETAGLNARVIAASSRDLREAVEAGRFFEELYYRLDALPIIVPPLRDRRDDIPLLVQYLLRTYSDRNRGHVYRVQSKALEMLCKYDWPGNVRECQNYIERAVVFAAGDELTCDLLPAEVLGQKPRRIGRLLPVNLDALVAELVEQGIAAAGPQADNLSASIVNRVEKELILHVLADCDNVQTKAADRLGINRNTLRKKLEEYGLEA